jgi:hypothetical protein
VITLQDEIENCFCDYKISCDILVTICPTYYIQGDKIRFQLQLSNPIRGDIGRKDINVNGLEGLLNLTLSRTINKSNIVVCISKIST